MKAEPAARRHALDALRAGAVLLGVAFHAALAYRAGPGGGWPRDPDFHHAGFDAFVRWSHAFRMELFCLLAGFFAVQQFRRRGALGFARERARRIALPFALGLVLLVPLLQGLLRFGQNHARSGRFDLAWEMTRAQRLDLAPWNPAVGTWHLWFLEYLLLLYALAGLLHGLARLLSRLGSALGARGDLTPLLFRPSGARSGLVRWISDGLKALLDWQRVEQWRRRVAASPFAALLVVPPAALLRFVFGPGEHLHGPSALVLDPVQLAYYGLFFGWGICLFHSPQRLETAGAHWRAKLAAALLVLPLFLPARAAGAATGASLAVRSLDAFASALATVLWVEALLALCVRFSSTPRPRVRRVADASYAIYLLHLPLVLAGQIALFHSPLPGPLRWAVVIASTLIVLLGGRAVWVRSSSLGERRRIRGAGGGVLESGAWEWNPLG